MKVIIRGTAADDLEGIYAWIAQDSPRAAAKMVKRIRDKIGTLETPELVERGRIGRARGTRELIEGRYIIVYRVDEKRDEVLVLSVLHGARRR